MTFLLTALGIFGLGVYIGVGAPGWPWKSEGSGRLHTQKRSINPIGWGRTPGRQRQRPKEMGDRKFNVRLDTGASDESSREATSRRISFRGAGDDEPPTESPGKPRINLRRG